jgi:glucose dehydrogenase
LDAATGKLKWYYQFTPGDTHDWDANEALVLADRVIDGKNRKLIMQADRNGMFYVLDRTDGKFLFAKPYVKQR